MNSYRITIVDADGNPTQTVERTSTGGTPRVGEHIEIDGAMYAVKVVRHDEDEGRTIRRYTTPHLYARIVVRGRLQ